MKNFMKYMLLSLGLVYATSNLDAMHRGAPDQTDSPIGVEKKTAKTTTPPSLSAGDVKLEIKAHDLSWDNLEKISDEDAFSKACYKTDLETTYRLLTEENSSIIRPIIFAALQRHAENPALVQQLKVAFQVLTFGASSQELRDLIDDNQGIAVAYLTRRLLDASFSCHIKEVKILASLPELQSSLTEIIKRTRTKLSRSPRHVHLKEVVRVLEAARVHDQYYNQYYDEYNVDIEAMAAYKAGDIAGYIAGTSPTIKHHNTFVVHQALPAIITVTPPAVIGTPIPAHAQDASCECCGCWKNMIHWLKNLSC